MEFKACLTSSDTEISIRYNPESLQSLESTLSSLKVLTEQVNRELSQCIDTSKFWRMRDPETKGLVPIAIKDMDDRHLANSLALLCRTQYGSHSDSFEPLVTEAKRRWGNLPLTYEEARVVACERGIKRFLNEYQLGETNKISVGFVLDRIGFNARFISLILKAKFGS